MRVLSAATSIEYRSKRSKWKRNKPHIIVAKDTQTRMHVNICFQRQYEYMSSESWFLFLFCFPFICKCIINMKIELSLRWLLAISIEAERFVTILRLSKQARLEFYPTLIASIN